MKKRHKSKKIRFPNTTMAVRATLAQGLELPREIMLNLPLLTVIGTREARIENFKNIIEFSEDKIRINTTSGILKIEGKNLSISEINSENICVYGEISAYCFSKS